jgi:hypothetical protein
MLPKLAAGIGKDLGDGGPRLTLAHLHALETLHPAGQRSCTASLRASTIAYRACSTHLRWRVAMDGMYASSRASHVSSF